MLTLVEDVFCEEESKKTPSALQHVLRQSSWPPAKDLGEQSSLHTPWPEAFGMHFLCNNHTTSLTNTTFFLGNLTQTNLSTAQHKLNIGYIFANSLFCFHLYDEWHNTTWCICRPVVISEPQSQMFSQLSKCGCCTESILGSFKTVHTGNT